MKILCILGFLKRGRKNWESPTFPNESQLKVSKMLLWFDFWCFSTFSQVSWVDCQLASALFLLLLSNCNWVKKRPVFLRPLCWKIQLRTTVRGCWQCDYWGLHNFSYAGQQSSVALAFMRDIAAASQNELCSTMCCFCLIGSFQTSMSPLSLLFCLLPPLLLQINLEKSSRIQGFCCSTAFQRSTFWS